MSDPIVFGVGPAQPPRDAGWSAWREKLAALYPATVDGKLDELTDIIYSIAVEFAKPWPGAMADDPGGDKESFMRAILYCFKAHPGAPSPTVNVTDDKRFMTLVWNYDFACLELDFDAKKLIGWTWIDKRNGGVVETMDDE